MSETQTDQTKTETDAELITRLLRENEMLKAEVKVRTDQVRQATDIAIKANQAQEARDAAEKQNLIDKIVVDSNRKFTPEMLKDKSLKELQLMNTVIQTSYDHTFASVAALQAEQDKKKHFGIDYWDRETQQWRLK
jgi:hypothetical protein